MITNYKMKFKKIRKAITEIVLWLCQNLGNNLVVTLIYLMYSVNWKKLLNEKVDMFIVRYRLRIKLKKTNCCMCHVV